MSRGRPDPRQGVFETLLVRDGRVPALDAHLARLRRSVWALYEASLPPETPARVTEAVAEAVAGVLGRRRARVDAVPGNGRIEIAITVSAVPARGPVTVTPLVVPGGLGPHKWRDRSLIEGPGPAALVVDADGSVLEAGWANVWTLDGDTLTTPPLDGRLLPGVTRARLLALAPSLGFQVQEEPITLAQAAAAPTLFVTSALRLAVPAGVSGYPAPERADAVDRVAAALDTG